MCAGMIPEADAAMLAAIAGRPAYDYKGSQPALIRWRNFDTALRNELVKIKASRRHVDASPYLRHDGESDISINHTAINAFRNPSILEGERMLDLARWKALEEIALGHYFDIDILIVYAIKLAILEKWERIDTVDSDKLITKAAYGN